MERLKKAFLLTFVVFTVLQGILGTPIDRSDFGVSFRNEFIRHFRRKNRKFTRFDAAAAFVLNVVGRNR